MNSVSATVFSSIPELALVAAVLAVAQLVYVMFGFGAGLIAVGALALFLPDIKDAVVLLLLVNIPAELFVVWRSRREIRWRGILVICVGIAIGVPAGTAILQLGDPSVVLTILGLFLVAVGVLFLVLPEARRIEDGVGRASIIGLVSGVLSGLFGTGGPPLIVYFRLRGIDKSAFRSHLMAIFLVVTAVRLPSYAFSGLLTAPRLTSALVVLPAVLLGGFVGHKVHLSLSERLFRRAVSVALALLGVLLLARHYA